MPLVVRQNLFICGKIYIRFRQLEITGSYKVRLEPPVENKERLRGYCVNINKNHPNNVLA